MDYLSLCLLLAVAVGLAFAALTPTSEVDALTAIYDATHGDYWVWNTQQDGFAWNFTNPNPNPCEDGWQGIGCLCSPSVCHVTALLLTAHNISGVLPVNITQLTYLQQIVLSRNFLSTTIPSLVGLQHLDSLDLSRNDLTGPIPIWLSNTTLKSISLNDNSFTGHLPRDLYNMSLVSLQMSNNLLTGHLSNKISWLTNLTVLELSFNRMNGSIPSSVGNLTKLLTLQLDHNFFSGRIPQSLTTLVHLISLVLSNNFLRGSIHSEFSQLTRLETLALSENFFTGELPDAWVNTSMITLDVTDNLLHGPIPANLGTNVDMLFLYLGVNAFTGTVPQNWIQLQQLKSLGVSMNQLHGNISQVIVGMPEINYFYIGSNQFTGPIPHVNWTALYYVNIEQNHLTGTLSPLLATDVLNYFVSGDNILSGTIPSQFGNILTLSYFSISYNVMTGPIITWPMTFQLSQLYLDNNLLSNTLPSALGGLMNLAELDVRNNRLWGTVPLSIANLVELQILFLSGNQFTGSLDTMVNATKQIYLTNIDVSHNFFTGSIPTEPFHISGLSSFAVSTNCLEGSLPLDICLAVNMTSLAMDGLSTATRCRNNVFPGIPYLNAFILKESLSGSIPECIFTIPGLISLHLSGNGLSGTLPSNITLSSLLQDINLSHNLLDGTIPLAIQAPRVPIRELDLSYNKFDGTLSSSFYAVPSGGELALDVNRLSGDIPSSLQSAMNISILDGNMFYCDIDRSSLPHHDPVRSSYDCGSDSINSSLYLLTALLILLTVSVLVFVARTACRQRDWYDVLMDKYHFVLKVMAFVRPSDSTDSSDDGDVYTVGQAMSFLDSIRRLFLVITLFTVVILLPIYVALTQSDGTYTIKYGWEISALMLKGPVAAFVLVFMLGLVFLLFLQAVTQIITHYKSTIPPWKRKQTSFDATMRVMLLSLINFVVMVVADCAYVYVVLNSEAFVVLLTQISMAMFKITWNEIAIWLLIPLLKRGLSNKREDDLRSTTSASSMRITMASPAQPTDDIIRYTTSEPSSARTRTSSAGLLAMNYSYSLADLRFLVFTTMLNNIIVPAVAIACVSTTCFYNALIAAPTVSDTYTILECTIFLVNYVQGVDSCVKKATKQQSISYDPPFIYSYQCASTVSVNYSAVFIFMFTASGIVLPVIKLSLHRIYAQFGDESAWKAKLAAILPARFKDPCPDDKGKPIVLMHKEKIVVRIVSYLAIILTFGTIYPPIAVVGSIAIYAFTYTEQYILGYLLAASHSAELSWYRQELSRQCAGIVNLFHSVVWQVMPFACVVIGYLMFDTMGYTEGWKQGFLAAVLFMVWPILFKTIGHYLLAYFDKGGTTEKWLEFTTFIIHGTDSFSTHPKEEKILRMADSGSGSGERPRGNSRIFRFRSQSGGSEKGSPRSSARSEDEIVVENPIAQQTTVANNV